MKLLAVEWRPVPWAPDYHVSSAGGVGRRINRFHPERRQFHEFKQEVDRDGYLYVRINGRKWPVHRLVYRVFVGDIDPSLVICHVDGVRTNNSARNLMQATQRENISHKKIHGTWQRGERHPRATISDRDAEGIKQMLALARRTRTGRLGRGEATRIAAETDISIHVVYGISTSKAWRHA